MATVLEVGQRIRLDHTDTTVQGRWARGRWHEYHLSDGRTFKGDVDELITAGRLVLLDPSTEEISRLTPSVAEFKRLVEENPAPDEFWEEDDEFDSPYGEDRED